MSATTSTRTVRAFLEDAVAAAPDAPFLSWLGATRTYGEFNRDVDRAARAWHDLGLVKGSRVAIVAHNRPEYLVAWFGLAKLGAVIVGINTGYKADEMGFAFGHAEPEIVLTDAAWLDQVTSLAPRHATIRQVLTFDPTDGYVSFGELIAAADANAPAAELDPDDVISLIYTSGTTGNPKAVMQTHEAYVLTGQGYAHWLRMTPDDALYVCLPLFHINAQAYATMGTIAAGARIVLAPRFSAGGFWSDVVANEVTVVNLVGAMLIILDRQEPGAGDAANHVRVIYSGGAVTGLSAGERARIEARYGVRLLGGYGMSEMTFGCIEPYDGRKKPGSMGIPRHHPDPTVPRTVARVVRADGLDADPGEVGELVLRGPGTMRGYFRDAAATAVVIEDDWVHTGDIVRRDEDGYFFFVDRKKDVIRRRGENIFSGEVEQVIKAHPDVAEAAVVAVRSEFMDDEVFAFVVPVGDRTPEPAAVADWVAEHLAAFKTPRYVLVVPDLPRTETNKISKGQLRELAENRRTEAYDRVSALRPDAARTAGRP
jgi:crotonobetaine/carnitine-CoA ligase